MTKEVICDRMSSRGLLSPCGASVTRFCLPSHSATWEFEVVYEPGFRPRELKNDISSRMLKTNIAIYGKA
jgi:hypothetical protein